MPLNINSDLVPLSLYIHYPWCLKKCPYCDFNSHTINLNRSQYTQHLLTDLDNDLAYVQNRPLQSIFIGGGTPSLMQAGELSYLLAEIKKRTNFVTNIEITLEANPASAEAKKFSNFRKSGVNRLSIGVQSFEDDLLTKIGRVHNGTEAKKAVLLAQKAGFDNINIDLMYGLPSQNKTQMYQDLQTAIDFDVAHLSYYQLSIEPNTYFAKYPPALPNDDVLYEAEQQAKRLLVQSGYLQYEVSAYAQTPCYHNLNYWRFGDYLGIGAGAHGKLSVDHKIIRTTKPKSPKDYGQKVRGKYCTIPKKQIIFEFMLNALRLKQGFSTQLFEKQTGLEFQSIEQTINQAIKQKLLIQNNNNIYPSEYGFDFLNDLQALFLPSA